MRTRFCAQQKKSPINTKKYSDKFKDANIEMEFFGYFFYRSEVSIILKLSINIDSLSIDLFNKGLNDRI